MEPERLNKSARVWPVKEDRLLLVDCDGVAGTGLELESVILLRYRVAHG